MTNKEKERVNQYKLLNDILTEKINDTITRHNIICDIIDKKEVEKILKLNR